MSIVMQNLPDDSAILKAMIAALQAENARIGSENVKMAVTLRFHDQLAHASISRTASARLRASAASPSARRNFCVWRSTVLDAILEVETALLDYRAATEAGDATLTDLIETEQSATDARSLLADTTYRRAQGFIALNVRGGSRSDAAP